MNYEIKNENILYEKILNANLFAGLFEQDFESSFEHPSRMGKHKKSCVYTQPSIFSIQFVIKTSKRNH